MKGRKPKPTKLKLVEGNPGKRAINDCEPIPETDLPDCPDYLKQVARVEWHRITVQLKDLGVLTGLDLAVVASYCIGYETMQIGYDILHKIPAVYTPELIQKMGLSAEEKEALKQNTYKSGILKVNPGLAIIDQGNKQMMKALAEIGLSPSSRSRIHVEKKTKRNELKEKYGVK